jgi:hypothetical protein
MKHFVTNSNINPLNAELNPICHLLALLRGATIVDTSRLRVKHTSIHIVTCVYNETGDQVYYDCSKQEILRY